MALNDGQRVYPVDKLVMHHAVSDDMVNWTDLQVQDWFSQIGKARGYSNGAVTPNHEHPSRPGQQTYAMAQYCLHRYTKDGNKYGWRLTELIKRPFQNVAWHAGQWGANQTSIGIETAGNYIDKALPYEALMCVADTLAREWDKEIGGALKVYGHKDWFATACPGQIYNRLGELVDMINNQAKWTDKLWPAPAPKPVPPAPKWVAMDNPRKMRAATELRVIDLTTNKPTGDPVAKNTDIEFVEKKDQNGTTYLRSKYSKSKNFNWGVDIRSLIEVPVVPPVATPPKPTEPEVPVTPPEPKPSDKDKEQDAKINALTAFKDGLIDFFTAIGKAITDFLSKNKKG